MYTTNDISKGKDIRNVDSFLLTKETVVGLNHDLRSCLKEIESTAHDLKERLQRKEDECWWKEPRIMHSWHFDEDIDSMSSALKAGQEIFKTATIIANKIKNEGIFSRIYHRIFW